MIKFTNNIYIVSGSPDTVEDYDAMVKGVQYEDGYITHTVRTVPDVSFVEWLSNQKQWVNVDTETNITNKIRDRKCVTIQFGNFDKQFVVIWPRASETVRNAIAKSLNSQSITKLLHNAAFDYSVMLNDDIVMENVYDTMLVEKIIYSANVRPKGFYSLGGLLNRYTGIVLDKSLQSSFDMTVRDTMNEYEEEEPEEDIALGLSLDRPLTADQLIYAAKDTKYLHQIRRRQLEEIVRANMVNVVNLECESVLSFTDATWNGFRLDTEKWISNAEKQKPKYEEAKREMSNLLMLYPEMRDKALSMGLLFESEFRNFKFSNPTVKRKLLPLIVPGIDNFTKPFLTKLVKSAKNILANPLETDDVAGLTTLVNVIESIQSDDTKVADDYFVENHRDYLVELEYLYPAGTCIVNWNSNTQVLALFQRLWPRLESVGSKVLDKLPAHRVLKQYSVLKKVHKLVTTYGEAFVEKYVDADGYVRASYNQIVTTGRVSSRNPNGQNLPATNEFRNPFIASEGFAIVGSDMSSQELCLIAAITKEQVFLDALIRGEDLHSIGAEVIYGKKWHEATEEGCVFESDKQKCECSGHKKLRKNVKTVNFMLAYGGGEAALAGNLGISKKEATDLMQEYFRKFPSVQKGLRNLGQFGVRTGMSMTLPPFNRRRYYPEWRFHRHEVREFLQGRFFSTLAEIERASMNHPIQGEQTALIKHC